MSGDESLIVCRRCRETIRVEDEKCPNCGTSIRSTGYLVAGLGLGLVLAAASLTNLGDLAFFGAVGLVIAGVTGYLLYEKRQRMQRAAGTVDEPTALLTEDDTRS